MFRLIGRTGPVFRMTEYVDVLGFIPCVKGVSLCGRWQTIARIEDVELVADVKLTEVIS